MSDSEYCWMWEHCPYKSAACRAMQPEDDGCYVYRRFKDIFKKQGLLKECTQQGQVVPDTKDGWRYEE